MPRLFKNNKPLSLIPADYATQVGAEETALILFDRRGILDWDERCWQRQAQHQGRSIGMWGM
ncbi:MAG: hypothetical protein CTY22_07370 [Methylomonas sp.]|nr:MAG: hypothetical protein CTY23_10825 [Methylomonas sp.]PPD25790.1 MAG: hypothetical protein CTY22_07370 [Methylomonas sp.]PPD36962.1 MAG: hypothetical protein CTY17_11050 [Methylomonas sp.]PPD37254.1 MAG: hypothetical protein CTY21_07370 [Methylomonas sp.]PPD52828.1 MAG: hypothetical protein CTY11_07910 [Methylomonas sp.]